MCVMVGIASACGGGDAVANGSASPAVVTPAAAASAPVAAPVEPIDPGLADQGEAAFTQRGCIACHYVGRDQRLVGPDLAGVTDRRSFDWYYAMVTNPDSMVRADEAAKKLFAEYMTPMTIMGATDEDIRAIWEYLRRATEDGGS
jgi:cytochrome c2